MSTAFSCGGQGQKKPGANKLGSNFIGDGAQCGVILLGVHADQNGAKEFSVLFGCNFTVVDRRDVVPGDERPCLGSMLEARMDEEAEPLRWVFTKCRWNGKLAWIKRLIVEPNADGVAHHCVVVEQAPDRIVADEHCQSLVSSGGFERHMVSQCDLPILSCQFLSHWRRSFQLASGLRFMAVSNSLES